MKKVINLTLFPTEKQKIVLHETLERCNEVCNWLSKQAFHEGKYNQNILYHLYYRAVREQYDRFPSQLAIKCIAKVCEAYKSKLSRRSVQVFTTQKPQPFDDRMMTVNEDGTISLLTIKERRERECLKERSGRIVMPFEFDNPTDQYNRDGDADLFVQNGVWRMSYLGVKIDEEG